MWTLVLDSLTPMTAALAIGLGTGWWLTRRREPPANDAAAPVSET